MTEILQLINNLDVVDLLDPDSIYLTSWELSLPPRRDTIHTPIYDNGSTLLSSQFDNLVETMTIAIVGSSHDNVITNLRNLTSILEAAKSYHVGLKSTPTYLAAKTNAETGTRYAVVKNYKLEKLSQALGLSTLRTGVKIIGKAYPSGFPQVVLVLELGLWQSNQPGSYDDIAVANYTTFNDELWGITTDGINPAPIGFAYVANKYNTAQPHDMRHFDDSSSTFSANINIHGAVPFNLFPSPIGVNDILYFGSWATSDSGPMSNVILRLSTVASVAMTVAWEYWNGSSWTTFDGIEDDTAGFTNPGTGSVSWEQPSDWVINTVNGTVAWWFRARITNLNGNSTVPVQGIRTAYSVTWPFIEIAEDQVTGDIPPLARLKIEHMSDDSATGDIDHIIMGLRTKSRGEDFCAIWPASDEQMPPGISFSGLSMSTSSLYPTGRVANENSFDDTPASAGVWTISSAYSSNYIGRFRVLLSFLFGTQGSPGPGFDTTYFYLEVNSQLQGTVGTGYLTDRKAPNAINSSSLSWVDFGEIDMASVLRNHSVGIPAKIEVFVGDTDGGTHGIIPIQLALIPVDEFSCQVTTRISTVPIASSAFPAYLDLDSTQPKELTALSRYTTTDDVFTLPFYNSVITPFFQANADQRMWFIMARSTVSWIMNTNSMLKVTAYAVRRYLALRGSD